MKSIGSFVFFFVILAVFVVVIVFEFKPSPVVSRFLGIQILPTSVEDLERVEVSSEDGHFTLNRVEEEWRIEREGAPSIPASPAHVGIFLKSLAGLHPTKEIKTADAEQLDLMGLSRPKFKFLLKDRRREKPMKLLAGNTSLEKSSIYVQAPSEGPEVYLVDIFNRKRWPSTYYDLVPRLIFETDRRPPSRIQVSASEETSEETWEIVKQKDRWVQKEGRKALEPGQVDALVRAVSRLSWDRVMGEKESFLVKINLAYPDWTIAVHYEDGGEKKAAISQFSRMFYMESPYDPNRVLRIQGETLGDFLAFLTPPSR